MSSRPIVSESLKLLQFMGMNPFKQSFLYSALKYFVFIILGWTHVDVDLKIALDWKGLDSMGDVCTALGTAQSLIKCTTMAIFGNSLARAVDRLDNFWETGKFGGKLKKSNERIFYVGRNGFRSMMIVIVMLFVAYYTIPLISDDKHGVPMPGYFTDGSSFRILTLIFQGIFFTIGVPMQMGFDAVYIGLIINIVCELRLLREGLSQICVESNDDFSCVKKLNELIEHHNLIYECIDMVRRIFSLAFLSMFIINMVGLGFCLICVVSKGTLDDLQNFVKFGTFTMVFSTQLLYYCLIGTILTDETAQVSDSAYLDTNWWMENRPKFRKSLTLVIQRSNRPEILTACGVIDVNLQTFTMIMRSALSFFTFIQAVLKV